MWESTWVYVCVFVCVCVCVCVQLYSHVTSWLYEHADFLTIYTSDLVRGECVLYIHMWFQREHILHIYKPIWEYMYQRSGERRMCSICTQVVLERTCSSYIYARMRMSTSGLVRGKCVLFIYMCFREHVLHMCMPVWECISVVYQITVDFGNEGNPPWLDKIPKP